MTGQTDASRAPAIRPVVSVVMPTYNTAPYLQQAIDSVVRQTFRDWELIIVDDGSTDETAAILGRCTDPRITIHTLPVNTGRSHARNVAVARAKGRYIAICDSDDESRPTRFERQVEFLDTHPDIGIVSAFIRLTSSSATATVEYPVDPAAIHRRFSAGKMGTAHGASMIRAECFQRAGNYCEALRSAEDFELFRRFSRQYRFSTLPHLLLDYRNPLGAVPLRVWREHSRAHRYALYHSCGGETPGKAKTLDEFSREWRTRLAVHTMDMLRFAHFNLKARLFSHYAPK